MIFRFDIQVVVFVHSCIYNLVFHEYKKSCADVFFKLNVISETFSSIFEQAMPPFSLNEFLSEV